MRYLFCAVTVVSSLYGGEQFLQSGAKLKQKEQVIEQFCQKRPASLLAVYLKVHGVRDAAIGFFGNMNTEQIECNLEFLRAIEESNLIGAGQKLKEGADIGCANNFALSLACFNKTDNNSACDFLFASGSSSNDKVRGISLLTRMVRRGSFDKFWYLLACGADVNCNNGEVPTAVIYRCLDDKSHVDALDCIGG